MIRIVHIDWKHLTIIPFMCSAVLAWPQGGSDLSKDEKQIFQDFHEARKNGQEEDAIRILENGAERGIAGAIWKLGRMYQIGDGVTKDPGKAAGLFEKLVEGNREMRPNSREGQFASNAMLVLGQYLSTGVPEAGIGLDPDRAEVMFTTAAEYYSNPQAQFELARIYLAKQKPESNTIRAARLLKRAKSSGHAGAEAMLGQILFEGKYVLKERVRGLTMLMNAQRHATGADVEWIKHIREEAFAVATEAERRAAIEAAAR